MLKTYLRLLQVFFIKKCIYTLSFTYQHATLSHNPSHSNTYIYELLLLDIKLIE